MAKLIRDITEITRCGSQYRAEHLARMGLKGCHASYLLEICTDPGISQETLAKRICINKSNVARQTAALEEAGFVTRSPSQTDKRIMRLYPTEKTLALLPEIRQTLSDWSRYITQDLSPQEREQLASILVKMKGRATAWMEEH